MVLKSNVSVKQCKICERDLKSVIDPVTSTFKNTCPQNHYLNYHAIEEDFEINLLLEMFRYEPFIIGLIFKDNKPVEYKISLSTPGDPLLTVPYLHLPILDPKNPKEFLDKLETYQTFA